MRYALPICVCLTTVVALATPARAADPASQRTDEQDLMRPTQHSLQMTPRLAQAMARYYVADEVETIIPLSEDQQAKLTDALARHVTQLTGTHREPLRDFCERSLELLMERDGHFTPETGREFAKGTDAVLPLAREFLEGLTKDARAILTPDQFKALETKLRRDGRELGQFEGKMRRWASGGAKDNEEIDDFEPADGEPPGPEERDAKVNARMKAERLAHDIMQELGPAVWARFLTRTKHFLNFDEQQSVRADQVLAKYRLQAEAIMTPEWTSHIRENCTRRSLYWQLGDKLPTAPLVFRLDREYRQAIAPLFDLGRKFYEEVFALATDAQLATTLAKISEAAAQHGLTVDESDAQMLHLARE